MNGQIGGWYTQISLHIATYAENSCAFLSKMLKCAEMQLNLFNFRIKVNKI